MTASRPKRVPDSNILDLRQLAAQQQAAVEQPRGRIRWRSTKRTTRSAKRLARPSGTVVDWIKTRRELRKFLFVVVIVGLPVGLVFGVARVTRAAGQATSLAKQGATSLEQGGQAMTAYDPDRATVAFRDAEKKFLAAKAELTTAVFSQTRAAGRIPVVGSKYRTGLGAITAAIEISRAGQVLASTLVGVTPPATTGITIEDTGIIQGSFGLLGPMLRQPQSFRQGLDHLLAAMTALKDVQTFDVPPAYQTMVATWRQVAPLLTEPGQRGGQVADFLTALFAGDQTKEFLVVFQNHDELRPTGGFIGTFLLVKFEKGIFKVLDAPVTGPFDLTAQIPHTSLPPQPILSIAPYWTFHDANWFLDVPTSSQFLIDFYEQARGFKPDGIFYLTPGLVESLLRLTGPIRPAGYGIDITADNFLRATEHQVEYQYNKALNNPKEFLIDLVPTLLQALTKLNATEGLLAAGVTVQHADQGDLLFFSADPATQKNISEIGWSGQLLTAPDDYLATVTTNLGGGKTDRAITESVVTTVTPQSQGLLHTVVITRHHGGTTDDPLTGVRNRSFLRVYAPASAQFVDVKGNVSTEDFFMPAEAGAKPTADLQAAEGTVLVDQTGSVRITNESGRKTFGAWSVVTPGQTSTVTFRYTTPLPTNGRWSLVWQKQPGAPRRDWKVIYQPGDKQTVDDIIGPGGKIIGGQATWSTNSDLSRSFGVVVR